MVLALQSSASTMVLCMACLGETVPSHVVLRAESVESVPNPPPKKKHKTTRLGTWMVHPQTATPSANKWGEVRVLRELLFEGKPKQDNHKLLGFPETDAPKWGGDPLYG